MMVSAFSPFKFLESEYVFQAREMHFSNILQYTS